MDGEEMKTSLDDVKKLMMLSVFEVFEKMYYIFLETVDEHPSKEERRLVEIRFSGDLRGGMQAYYSETLARTMIENALGLDEKDVTEQILEDCLKEGLNMICGSFLQKYEQEKVLQLSIPSYVGKASLPALGDAPGEIWISLDSDGMLMDLIMRFDGMTN